MPGLHCPRGVCPQCSRRAANRPPPLRPGAVAPPAGREGGRLKSLGRGQRLEGRGDVTPVDLELDLGKQRLPALPVLENTRLTPAPPWEPLLRTQPGVARCDDVVWTENGAEPRQGLCTHLSGFWPRRGRSTLPSASVTSLGGKAPLSLTLTLTLLLSPAPPGPEGPRLSCVSPRPPGPGAQSRSPHPTPGCSRGFEATASHVRSDEPGTPLPAHRARGSHHRGGLHGEGPYSVF